MNYLQEGLKKLNIETVENLQLETDLEKYIKELKILISNKENNLNNDKNYMEINDLNKIQEIIEKGYLFSGEEHQNGLTGVPVFSDGTCFRASMRSWGMICTPC